MRAHIAELQNVPLPDARLTWLVGESRGLAVGLPALSARRADEYQQNAQHSYGGDSDAFQEHQQDVSSRLPAGTLDWRLRACTGELLGRYALRCSSPALRCRSNRNRAARQCYERRFC